MDAEEFLEHLAQTKPFMEWNLTQSIYGYYNLRARLLDETQVKEVMCPITAVAWVCGHGKHWATDALGIGRDRLKLNLALAADIINAGDDWYPEEREVLVKALRTRMETIVLGEKVRHDD